MVCLSWMVQSLGGVEQKLVGSYVVVEIHTSVGRLESTRVIPLRDTSGKRSSGFQTGSGYVEYANGPCLLVEWGFYCDKIHCLQPTKSSMPQTNNKNKMETSKASQSTKKAKSTGKTNADNTKVSTSQPSRMKRLLGFELRNITSWRRFVELMNEPRDASSLGVLRIIFGILMLVDIPQERGMARIDTRFGNPNTCHFPLFNFLQPLPVDWMYVVYLVMLAGAIGVVLGAFYRFSCILFIIPYWYVFFLDKTVWNNHSYLYGLISFQLLFYDANRFWSIDARRNPKLRNTHVPLWNYALIRTQIFLVYFLAGIKKIDADWLFGYSMGDLSRHWVFSPFKLILTDQQVDLVIVHIGGFLLDLTIGFFLFFDRTRPYAFVFCGNFHIMNSQIFSIGMFPYAMLATMPVFCYADWPRSLISRLPTFLSSRLLDPEETQQPSDHCVYLEKTPQKEPPKEVKGKESKDKKPKKESSVSQVRLSLYHHLASCFFILYLASQLFLPFSHFLTKGYNGWTNGLYGYSWDMMVHNWHTQHIKLEFVDRKTGKTGYLSPDFFTSGTGRWVGHGDMIKQLATCVASKMKAKGYEEPALYIDVWKSMNGRFSQRMWDPRVDMVTAPWSPFEDVEWHLPLLTELSNWRGRVDEMEAVLVKDEIDVAFVADFPGLYLENYVSKDFANTTLEVLKGTVKIELYEEDRNVTLTEGSKMLLPSDEMHSVHTVSSAPSCYMYTFVNGTAIEFNKKVEKFLNEHLGVKNVSMATVGELKPEDLNVNMSDPTVALIVDHLLKANESLKKEKRTMREKINKFFLGKAVLLQKTFLQTSQALGHILLGMDSVVTTANPPDANQQDKSDHRHDDGDL